MGNLSEVSAQSADTVDERSADQIVAAKEAVLELPHAPFVAAVLDGSIATTAVAAGLGDVAEEVRDAALSLARAAVSGDAAAGKSSEILSALAAAVDAAVADTPAAPANRAEDHVRGAIVALYGHCANETFPAGDAGREPALKRILASLRVLDDHGAFLASRSLASLAGDLGLAASALVSQLKSEALTGTTPEARRAHCCRGCGGYRQGSRGRLHLQVRRGG